MGRWGGGGSNFRGEYRIMGGGGNEGNLEQIKFQSRFYV